MLWCMSDMYIWNYTLRFSGMLHEVELNSLDVSNLLWDIQKTCVTNEDIELLWEIKNVWLVKNKDMEDRYEKKRDLMKSLVWIYAS